MKAKSFTLVELLVVIMIIGVLASLVVLSMQSSVKKTKEARAKDSLKKTQTAIVQMQLVYPDMTVGEALGSSSGFADIPVNKIKGADGSLLLTSTPLDGLGNPVQMVWNATNYVISGKSAQDESKCWYVSDISSNISRTDPSLCSSIRLGM